MFYIQVSNGLLTPEHYKKMGTAVWLFMWCIDHITLIDEQGHGWVYGRKPIVSKDIAKDLGMHEITVREFLIKLRQGDYIQTIRTPRGLQIGVNKAKKTFRKNGGNSVDKQRITPGIKNSDVAKRLHGRSQMATTNIRQLPKDSINTNNNNGRDLKSGKLQKDKKALAEKMAMR